MTYFNTLLQLYVFDEQDSINITEALKGAGIDEADSGKSSALEALEWLNSQLQQKFMRPEGAERQQLITSSELNTPENIIRLSAFTREIMSGANDSIKLLLGASEPTVRARLNTLLEITQKGHHTATIYPLGGQRDLWPIAEKTTAILVAERLSVSSDLSYEDALTEVNSSFEHIFAKAIEMQNKAKSSSNNSVEDQKAFVAETNRARADAIKTFIDKGIIWPTETDMMNRVVQEYKNTHPEFANIDFKPTVNALKNANGSRPNTLDTLIKLKQEPSFIEELARNKVLNISIISGQPNAHYQRMQTISALADLPIKVGVVAGAAANVTISPELLDGIARMVYAGKDYVSNLLSTETENQSQYTR